MLSYNIWMELFSWYIHTHVRRWAHKVSGNIYCSWMQSRLRDWSEIAIGRNSENSIVFFSSSNQNKLIQINKCPFVKCILTIRQSKFKLIYVKEMVSGFVICGKLLLTLKKCFRVFSNFKRAFETDRPQNTDWKTWKF